MENSDINWEDVSFITRSKHRKKTCQILHHAAHPSDRIPSQIADETDLPISHVSRALSELKERGIVTVLNPDDKQGRIYALTDKGEQLCDQCC